MGSALGERPSPSRCYPRPVNGTSTAPNGTVGMPPRAGRHRIDPPAAAAKRSTLRPLVIYIYARKRFLQSLALGPPPVPQSPDRRCLVRRSGTESSQTRRWRETDSNFLVPGRETVRPSWEDRTAVLKTAAELSRNRRFESVFLQWRVRSEHELQRTAGRGLECGDQRGARKAS